MFDDQLLQSATQLGRILFTRDPDLSAGAAKAIAQRQKLLDGDIRPTDECFQWQMRYGPGNHRQLGNL